MVQALTKWLLRVVVVLVGAGVLTLMTDRRPFEEISFRSGFHTAARGEGAKCPVSAEIAQTGDLDVLALCAEHGLSVVDAMLRYPQLTKDLLTTYGGEEDSRRGLGELLSRFRPDALPVVEYFRQNGARDVKAAHALTEAWSRLKARWTGQQRQEVPELTPYHFGLIAIDEINRRGYTVLAAFEIVDGVAKSRAATRIVFETLHLLFGEASHLEKILVRRERSPTLNEVGRAALEVAIAGGVGALFKGAKTVSTASKLNKVWTLTKIAGKVTIGGGKKAAIIASFAFLYVAVTQPDQLAIAVGWVGEQLGVPREVGIFATFVVLLLFCTLAALSFVRFVRFVTWPVRAPLAFAIRRFT